MNQKISNLKNTNVYHNIHMLVIPGNNRRAGAFESRCATCNRSKTTPEKHDIKTAVISDSQSEEL